MYTKQIALTTTLLIVVISVSNGYSCTLSIKKHSLCLNTQLTLSSIGQKDLNQQLLEAARLGQVEQVRLLLDKGANINGVDEQGTTPLMKAISSNNFELIAILIAKGADVNAKNRYGNTALMNAAEADNIKALEILLHNGAEINIIDKYGYTALTHAAFEVCSNIAKFI